jgi:hypothetical protein
MARLLEKLLVGCVALCTCASAVMAFAPTCYKKRIICDAGGCGQANFRVCDDGWEPGCPGKYYGLISPARMTKCKTYVGAMQSIEGGCDTEPPTGYEPAGCSNLAFGVCCYVYTGPDPDPPIIVEDWRYVLEPTGGSCACP